MFIAALCAVSTLERCHMHLTAIRIAVAGMLTAAFLVTTATASSGAANPATTAPTQTAITVASYNLCAGACASGADKLAHSFSYRAGKIAPLVKSVGADVLAIQEGGGTNKARNTLAKKLKAQGYARAIWLDSRALFYRASTISAAGTNGQPLEGRGFVLRSPRKGGETRQGVVQILRSKKTGQRFIVSTMHLSSGDGLTTDEHRLDEVTQAQAYVQQLAAEHPTLPVMYVGDFNSLDHRDTTYDSDSERWRVTEQMAAVGLTDGWTKAKATGGQVSLRSSLNQIPKDKRKFPPAFQLDRIYVDEHTAVKSLHVRAPLARKAYKQQYSDHNMLFVKLVMTG
jgi:endonuclease/exonuclease/phosphatase family metal-dependent hydrolase